MNSKILLPQSIQNLLKFGVDQLDPDRVILFGSRARGTHRENSDFDIAFAGIRNHSNWSRFLAEASDQPITLHKVDLLIYEHLSADYRTNIDREGIAIYER